MFNFLVITNSNSFKRSRVILTAANADTFISRHNISTKSPLQGVLYAIIFQYNVRGKLPHLTAIVAIHFLLFIDINRFVLILRPYKTASALQQYRWTGCGFVRAGQHCLKLETEATSTLHLSTTLLSGKT